MFLHFHISTFCAPRSQSYSTIYCVQILLFSCECVTQVWAYSNVILFICLLLIYYNIIRHSCALFGFSSLKCPGLDHDRIQVPKQSVFKNRIYSLKFIIYIHTYIHTYIDTLHSPSKDRNLITKLVYCPNYFIPNLNVIPVKVINEISLQVTSFADLLLDSILCVEHD
jgi:hypothetical protein